jgi:hypothetical protein
MDGRGFSQPIGALKKRVDRSSLFGLLGSTYVNCKVRPLKDSFSSGPTCLRAEIF